MSSVKISQLSEINHLNINTDQTVLVGVDLLSDITGKISITTLAEGLYSENPLKVGYNQVFFPNSVGQFSGNSASYLQVNMQNYTSSGSGDFVVTADTGSDSSRYIDLGINNSGYSDPTFSAMYPYDGYLYVQGTSSNSNDGNLIIGTSTSNTNIKFIVGGTKSNDIIGYMTSNGFVLNQNTSFTFGDGTTQSTAAATNAYSIATRNIANSASANTIYLFGALNQTNTNIVNANTQLKSYTDGIVTAANTQLKAYADGAISSANTQLKSYTDGAIASANTQLKSYTDGKFLANTNGNTFAGALNITDKLNVNGSVIFANTQFTATESALTIAACPIGDVQLPSNDGYMLHISGKQNVSSRIVFDSYGANTYVVVAGRTARGTPIAPQAVANGDILMRMSGNGYGTTKFSTLGSGRIDIVATENFTDAARATQIQFFTTTAGTNTQTQIASFNGSSAIFSGVVNPQKGFIYNPNVISGIINTLNIDIANNSLYKFNCNATTTINLNGYSAGKVVEVWLTNVDTGVGSNHTITHGCYANNSTIGAASFTLSSLHSAYLRYFSIDGDLANTFVSVNYS